MHNGPVRSAVFASLSPCYFNGITIRTVTHRGFAKMKSWTGLVFSADLLVEVIIDEILQVHTRHGSSSSLRVLVGTAPAPTVELLAPS